MRRPASHKVSHKPTPSLELVGNWTVLEPGDKVLLYRGGKVTGSGNVDLRSHNGNVFWILREGGQGRAMIHKTDNIAVYRRTAQTSRPRQEA
ncbi:hypothetical protein [Arthrobacter sp. Z4-13]